MNIHFIFIILILTVGFNINIIFINEEFLLFCTLSLFFFIIYQTFRKSINLFFFLRIEFIYISFLYLIKSNKILNCHLYRVLKLLKLKLIKLDFIVLTLNYAFEKLIQKLSSIKSITNLIQFQTFFAFLLTEKNVKVIKINFVNLYLNKIIKILINYDSKNIFN